ncbi:tRNA uridine-5-carboxymethylaminomethyl(34) synthesis GTPase MnmE [Thioalkalicoccus limnaeus]|uniref:tRNA modification GTPase MnmE n=1 Tax=Thioalkalicoccus limnaeus TaxID=120681 RepID=A0ABV4BDZ2_9GAMM
MTPIDTIAAIATPNGVGGVGILRVSGPLVATVCQSLLGRTLDPRYATYSRFRDPDGVTIDHGLAILFPAPRSFTGEDVLELHAHGGPVVLDLLLAALLRCGARLARPGEFTERAFLNGKLDLAQAEAIADLIESSTVATARSAVRTLEGELSRKIQDLVERLVDMRVEIEAALDFPDEELDLLGADTIGQGLVRLIAETQKLLAGAHQGRLFRDGLVVVIAGPPNAGKSSLMNALTNAETAIVTPIPGTTRDLLRERIQIDGLPVQLIDTAGLRPSDDPIEVVGMERARTQLSAADLVLWVFDGTEQDIDYSRWRQELPTGIAVTWLRNKIDLTGHPPGSYATPFGQEIALSASTGQGLPHLHEHLRGMAGDASDAEGVFLARRRHITALEGALAHLETAREALLNHLAPEMVAEDLRQAQRRFGEITGQVSSEDLLERIFSSFCIGK